MNYTKNLRRLRKEHGLTQQQLADFLYMDRSAYAYYESGRTKASLDLLLQIAQFYHVSLSSLLGEEPHEPAPDSGSDPAMRFSQLSRNEKRLVVLCRSGTPAQREALLEASEALAEQ